MTGIDLAEATGARATRPVDHERGRPLGPALEDVGASGLFADRDQVEGAHRALEADILGPEVRLDAKPVRLALAERLCRTDVHAGFPQPAEQPYGDRGGTRR